MAAEEGNVNQNISTFETYVSTPNERTVLLIRAPNESPEARLGLLELRDLSFWRNVFEEFLSTLLFVMIACGSVLTAMKHADSNLHNALCTGFIVTILVSVNTGNSGYFNPAISFGLLVARKIKPTRCLFYVAVQLAGSISGAGLLYLYTPDSMHGKLGVVALHPEITSAEGFLVELTLTFILVWAVMATIDPIKNFTGFQSPHIVGLTYSVGILMAGQFTGGALNPIRAFGPAVIMDEYDNHWVYWIGPLVAAFSAAISYEFVFKSEKEKESSSNVYPKVQLNINSTNM